jgi:hypothetical protein
MATSKTVPVKSPAKSRKSIGEAAASMDPIGVSDQPEEQEPARAVKRQKQSKPPYTKFKRLENRQKAVEQNRRAVYAHLDKITQENIKLAKKGNSAIAKFLFDFAGINQLPALVEASSKARKAASGGENKTDEDPTKAVLSFYKKLGMTPPKLKPPRPVEAVEAEADEQPAAV